MAVSDYAIAVGQQQPFNVNATAVPNLQRAWLPYVVQGAASLFGIEGGPKADPNSTLYSFGGALSNAATKMQQPVAQPVMDTLPANAYGIPQVDPQASAYPSVTPQVDVPAGTVPMMPATATQYTARQPVPIGTTAATLPRFELAAAYGNNCIDGSCRNPQTARINMSRLDPNNLTLLQLNALNRWLVPFEQNMAAAQQGINNRQVALATGDPNTVARVPEIMAAQPGTNYQVALQQSVNDALQGSGRAQAYYNQIPATMRAVDVNNSRNLAQSLTLENQPYVPVTGGLDGYSTYGIQGITPAANGTRTIETDAGTFTNYPTGAGPATNVILSGMGGVQSVQQRLANLDAASQQLFNTVSRSQGLNPLEQERLIAQIEQIQTNTSLARSRDQRSAERSAADIAYTNARTNNTVARNPTAANPYDINRPLR